MLQYKQVAICMHTSNKKQFFIIVLKFPAVGTPGLFSYLPESLKKHKWATNIMTMISSSSTTEQLLSFLKLTKIFQDLLVWHTY